MNIISQGQQTTSGKWRVKNILTSLLWLIASLAGTLVLILQIAPGNKASDTILYLLVMTVIVLIFFFIYFAFKDPNRLQSEEYNIKKDELLYQIQGREISPRAVTTLTAGPNPIEQLEQEREEGQ